MDWLITSKYGPIALFLGIVLVGSISPILTFVEVRRKLRRIKETDDRP